MRNNDRCQRGCAQSYPLPANIIEKCIGHDDGCRAPFSLQRDRIVHTARCAGSSIANRRYHRVVSAGDLTNEFLGRNA